jgi:putative ABC transport system permease protein
MVRRSLLEGFFIAWTSLWTNKMRAFLTTFGIVIGIVSVTTMATVIDGVNRGFESSLNMLGQNVVYIQKWPWNFGPNYNWWDYINRRELEVNYAAQIEELSTTVEAVSAIMYASTPVSFESEIVDRVDVRGVSPSYIITGAIGIAEGRFFTDEENRAARNVAIIGNAVSDALFGDRDPIGRTVRAMGQRFEVIGVMEAQGSFMGLESFDNQFIVPIQTYGRIYGFRRFIQLQVKFANEEMLEAGQYEVEGVMRRIRKLEPGAENDFAINKLDMFRQQYQVMTGAIYGVGYFLTGLALFIGGIGVMNIMFVSVKERTKEVGIRKAIGAKSSEILYQFLVESVVICSFGGIIGVLISIGTSALLNQFFVAYMDWTTVLTAFFMCAAVGIIFGFLPAYRAAKADPIESLRYE